MEEIVTFQNKNGKQLIGIVHVPEDVSIVRKRVGIALLNPGIKYRVAPHRLNVKLARNLSSRGYFVFRYDPEGIGDSEGELPVEKPISDIWGSIQRGLFVNDLLEANLLFYKRWKLDELILVGNCGGAITALLAAERDCNMDGLCLIDVPVYLWDSTSAQADLVAGGNQTNRLFQGYLRNIFSVSSWYNLVTWKTDFRTVWRILKLKVQERFFTKKSPVAYKSIKDLCFEKKLNYFFFQSISNIITCRKPVLFISAGNDPGRETFKAYFQDYYLLRKELIDNLFEFFIIESANHIYSLTESQEMLFDRIITWLLCHNFSPINE